MNTAQRLAAQPSETFAQGRALESEARDLAVQSSAENCYDRTWTFADGSSLAKTRDGYAEAA